MGLNPLIAARSYIFHVFFILPQELTQEINILFFNSWPVCVCVFGVCVFLFIGPENITNHVLNFTFWKPAAKTHLPCRAVASARASGQQGAVVCLFLLWKHWMDSVSVAAFVSSTTDSTQGQLHNGLWMSSHSSQLISGPNPLTVRRGTSLSS